MKTDNDLIRALVEESSHPFATSNEKETFISDWYFARAFLESEEMMEKMCRVDHKGNITNPLCITLEGTSVRMRAVLRELILRAHYIDFDEEKVHHIDSDEENIANVSVITILYDDSEEAAKATLLGTPFLGNYLHYLWEEPLGFLDIRIKFLSKATGIQADVTQEMLDSFSYIGGNAIDTNTAEYANRIYCLGSDLSNLPAIDMANAEMYQLPLQVFEAGNFKCKKIEDWEKNDVKGKLSNVFCTDTFKLRKMMLERGVKQSDDIEKQLKKAVVANILPLSKCEHSRWVAEKLILGFRPWTLAEHYQYDRTFGDDKKAFYKKLKKKAAHYNICSYHTLTRIEPKNLRYDTFLVLAMLEIISQAEKGE